VEAFEATVKIVQFQLLPSKPALLQVGQKAEQDNRHGQEKYKENVLRKKGI